MSDRPEWFAAHRYGMGIGWPIAWQGWVMGIALILIVLFAWWLFGDDDSRSLAIIIPAVFGYIIIAARTTRGGFRWRWGGDEE